jgi:sugar phosphate isomerase/epimerase
LLIGAGSYLFRYSVGTQAFQPEKPISALQLVEKAADLGFELVQFADNLPLDTLDNAMLSELGETAAMRSIVLEVGTAGATVDRMIRYLDIAERLNAKLVRLAPHAPDTHPTMAETLAVIKEILPRYRKAGLAIAVENHFTMSSEDLAGLVREINDPFVGVCLDTANSIVQQEWPIETVGILGEFTLNLHLKDYKLSAHPDGIGVMITGAPLGYGDQNIEAILNFLRDTGKNVNMVLEQWMPTASTVQETLNNEELWIRQSIETAHRIRKERHEKSGNSS